MQSGFRFTVAIVGSLVCGAALVSAQQAQTPPTPAPGSRPAIVSTDPRVGLKPGLTDAGMAAKNIELVSNLPKPGIFADTTGGLNFANSDLAFKGHTLALGNFAGVNFYSILDPREIALTMSMPCPGGQGDVSIYKNLMFMSVEQTRGRIDCGDKGVAEPISAERFRGVRIFDITDVKKPKQIAAVQTCRGSHTHTLVEDPKDKANIYIYGQGTGGPRDTQELAGCSAKDPKDDPNTSLFSIDVIKVPLASPEKAAVVNSPRIFAAPTGEIAGLWLGGNHGDGTQTTSQTNQCHDITVYPKIGLAAGACSGNGILLDISDPVHPVRIDQVSDKNFAYWHSATFNNDGTKVIFTDEWGGGTNPRCRATDLPNWGADAIFDIVDRKLVFKGYYKMPAPQTDTENCVAHNGSLVPVPGRDIKAQAWYQGGISVFDFTDSANPVEIAYFDRGPVSADKLVVAGYWSTYWFNGYIYGSEIARGIDVLKLLPSDLLTQNEIDAANLVKYETLNVQEQPQVTWPASFVVSKAYVDQLARAKALPAMKLTEISTAISAATAARTAAMRTSTQKTLDALAADLNTAAASAASIDAARMKALGASLVAAGQARK